MTLRRPVLPFVAIILLAAVATPVRATERYTTENFEVHAPTKELAKTFGEYAEKYRQEKALDWLGYEMPRWPQRCPLKVQITMSQTGGATTFTFGTGPNGKPGVQSQEMKIFGTTDQLLKSVLPHEVTHTVLAHHFGQAVPRWADEGGSVLSENDEERYNHDIRCREILNQGRGIPLRVLLTLTEYPKDMIVVYAQGYSLCQFLIDQDGGKQKFLKFVGTGMRSGNHNWEEAVRMYGYNSSDELQEAWIAALRKPPQTIASRKQPGDRPATAASTVASLTSSGKGPETRTSAVAILPKLEDPIVARGAAPSDQDDRSFGSTGPARSTATAESAPRLAPRLLPPEPPSRR